MERRFLGLEPALRAFLRPLAGRGGGVDARHDHLALLGHGLDDLTGAALVLARQHHDLVALLDPLRGHPSTSGASEMIFMCLRARSSRTTGPKMRVPIGSSFLLTSTAALESKRITEPSGRRMSLAVRTITAR